MKALLIILNVSAAVLVAAMLPAVKHDAKGRTIACLVNLERDGVIQIGNFKLPETTEAVATQKSALFLIADEIAEASIVESAFTRPLWILAVTNIVFLGLTRMCDKPRPEEVQQTAGEDSAPRNSTA